MLQNHRNGLLGIAAVYALYIILGAALGSAMHLVYAKYTLNLPLHPVSFLIPILAGVIYGYATAYVRHGYRPLETQSPVWIYARYLAACSAVMIALNIIHTEWILGMDLEPLFFIAPVIAGLFFGYLAARIRVLNNTLLELASTDMVTRAFNRSHFEKVLNAEIDRCNRYGGFFSLIYFKIDRFDAMHMQMGHDTGDTILAIVAKVARESNRSSDIFARFNDDGFVIAAMQTLCDGAYKHAQRIRTSIENLNLEKAGKITCSFGVAEFLQGKDDVPSLIRAAYDAMLQGAQHGGDCVIRAQRTAGSQENPGKKPAELEITHEM